MATKIYELATKIFLFVASWLPNEKLNFEPCTVPLFAETFNKEVSNVLCEKPIILVELLFELRNVVIQDSEDGKRTACKEMR